MKQKKLLREEKPKTRLSLLKYSINIYIIMSNTDSTKVVNPIKVDPNQYVKNKGGLTQLFGTWREELIDHIEKINNLGTIYKFPENNIITILYNIIKKTMTFLYSGLHEISNLDKRIIDLNKRIDSLSNNAKVNGGRKKRKKSRKRTRKSRK